MEHEDSKIYGILLEQNKALGRIEAQVGSVVKLAADTKLKVDEHETIISNWKGRITVIAIVAGLFWNLAVDWFKSKFL